MEITLNHLKRPEESAVDVSRRLQKRTRWGELFIQTFLFLCGAVSIFTTLGIVYELGKEALLFFQMPGVTLVEFFTQTEWQPTVGRFGVLPLVSATVVTTVIAMLVAVPFGLGSAIYLSEYASEKARKILKPALEVLAGIPTVVYGYFALTTVTPFLRIFFGEALNIYNMLSAGLTMGIMIIPLVASISEDALHAVPNSLREGAYAMGATRLETALQVVVPAALSGIIAGFILGFSRAIGETMIVAIAAGSGPNFTFNPLQSAETMTGYIARISGGDVAYDTPDYNSIFAIGLVLFGISLILNIISRRVSSRLREVYE